MKKRNSKNRDYEALRDRLDRIVFGLWIVGSLALLGVVSAWEHNSKPSVLGMIIGILGNVVFITYLSLNYYYTKLAKTDQAKKIHQETLEKEKAAKKKNDKAA